MFFESSFVTRKTLKWNMNWIRRINLKLLRKQIYAVLAGKTEHGCHFCKYRKSSRIVAPVADLSGKNSRAFWGWELTRPSPTPAAGLVGLVTMTCTFSRYYVMDNGRSGREAVRWRAWQRRQKTTGEILLEFRTSLLLLLLLSQQRIPTTLTYI